MDLTILVQSVGLAGVALLGLWDITRADEAIRRQRCPRERTDTASSRRCPYCHGAVTEDEADRERVRCAECTMRHHADCWAEHARCSVFGCESEETRQVRGPESESPKDETSSEP